MNKLIIYTDGGARGNPGPAGAGVVIYDENKKIITREKKYLGDNKTNNQAEYSAVILALEKAKELKAGEIEMYLDSELVVKQLSQKYKIKDKNLGSLFVKIWNLSQNFKKIDYHHIPREENREADRLVNKAIDEHQEK